MKMHALHSPFYVKSPLFNYWRVDQSGRENLLTSGSPRAWPQTLPAYCAAAVSRSTAFPLTSHRPTQQTTARAHALAQTTVTSDPPASTMNINAPTATEHAQYPEYPQYVDYGELHQPRALTPNPILELFTLIKSSIISVFDLRASSQDDHFPHTHVHIHRPYSETREREREQEHSDRSCVDLLRRLLGAGGATELRINSLPARLLHVEKGRVEESLEFDQDCCAICLDGYEKRNRVRILSCNHCFHADCIDSWLRKSATCPMCQVVVC